MAQYKGTMLRAAAGLLLLAASCLACTNMLFSPTATTEGHSRIAYAADDGALFGSLGYIPAGDHPPGTMREIWDWDSGQYLGSIPEAAHTYSVAGNMNEHGLAIGETTFGGLSSLATQDGAIVDYGNLIWVTLQRCKTAREAIAMMDNLTSTYGYASSGESFSLADKEEVWLLELIGKGPGERGAVWVAQRVPDGMVTSHANQARQRTFPLDSPDCLYAKDVITFAQAKGLYPKSAPASQFSFADAYNPISFAGARFCDARVWSFFRTITPGMEQYLDYVQGRNLTNRLPLFVKPNATLSLASTFAHMRTHNEGSWFDNQGLAGGRPDVGAGAFHSPYRWRPLEWQSGGEGYVNERSIGTQQTGWHFVAEVRKELPDPIAGVLWFGVDDTAHSVHVPIYGGVTAVPSAFGDPYGQTPEQRVSYGVQASAAKGSFKSAFWVFNLVANLAYSRYSLVHPEVAAKIVTVETGLQQAVAEMDAKAAQLFKTNPAAAIDAITAFSVSTGNGIVETWLDYFMELFVKYRDGFVFTAPKLPTCTSGQTKGCTFRPIPNSDQAGYDALWYNRIVTESGDHYKVPTAAANSAKEQPEQVNIDRFL